MLIEGTKRTSSVTTNRLAFPQIGGGAAKKVVSLPLSKSATRNERPATKIGLNLTLHGGPPRQRTAALQNVVLVEKEKTQNKKTSMIKEARDPVRSDPN